jgi:hypothetical protein
MQKKRKKQMNKQTVIIVVAINIFLSSLIIISCKDNLNSEKEIVKEVENVQKKFKNKLVEFEFDFPDTIQVDKLYNGKIKYKSVLDTITTSFDDEKKSRYISFYMSKTKYINYEIEELKTMRLDTFGAIDNRTIPFYDLKFTELGVHYIDGIINDHISIDTLIKSKKSIDKVRYIENVVRATHKVVVIK